MINQLGRYEILGELGHGAMGVVYKARDPLIDRVVAIKTINLGLALDEKKEYEERFYQEAKAAGRLSHPNIVTIYDVGKSGDIAYIAMEFLQGRELRDIMNDGELLPVDRTLSIVAQVAQGLAYAHEHEIVHRDVKPANIMVGDDGHVKITDFGIARMASSAVRTQTGMVLGSPKYMSPEQVMGKTIDRRTDIFSLGVMLYEMLTGEAPFSGENVNAIMYQTLNVAPVPPSKLNVAVPDMLNFIVAKALAKGLDDRYQSAKDFAIDLRACSETLSRSLRSGDTLKPPASTAAKLPDAIGATGPLKTGEEEEHPALGGLSPAFDSTAATMRLASLTGINEDVDELSKILKAAPSGQKAGLAESEISHPASRRPSVRSGNKTAARPGIGNLLLIIVVSLVLLGIVAIFVF